MDFIIGFIFTILAGIFAYGSWHIDEEQRIGRGLHLPWEKQKRKIFDKSDLEYRDGDNT
tara:strand:- start:617 stop:793 length:177 start_codon:yes stop_codon:yes gene_type:complete